MQDPPDRGGFAAAIRPIGRPDNEAIMKALTSAAVFGLVPVPPMPSAAPCSDTEPCRDNGLGPASQLVDPQREDGTERMATKDELTRIRGQLEDASAE
jgi:hypothetical protein